MPWVHAVRDSTWLLCVLTKFVQVFSSLSSPGNQKSLLNNHPSFPTRVLKQLKTRPSFSSGGDKYITFVVTAVVLENTVSVCGQGDFLILKPRVRRTSTSPAKWREAFSPIKVWTKHSVSPHRLTMAQSAGYPLNLFFPSPTVIQPSSSSGVWWLLRIKTTFPNLSHK